MIPLLSAEEMRSLEMASITDWGMSSLVLQEHAALGALALLPAGEPLEVLAGPGNNGGDALALARLARLQGRQVRVWALAAEPVWRGDAAHQATLWRGLGGEVHTLVPDVLPGLRGWVVDGLFGLGTRLPLGAPVQAILEAFAREDRGLPVLALDLPTGLDPSSSEVEGPVLRARKTACFGHRKICHGLRPAQTWCGEVHMVPIPLRDCPTPRLRMVESLGPCFPMRWDTHKRDFGHVGIRAGRVGMSGAAALAALGALCAGAGLVTVLPDPEVRAEVAAHVPEAMVRPWEGRLPQDLDVLLVGPGGVDVVPAWDGPLVLDASALLPGEGPRWMTRPRTVLTPHPGEFSRLFGLGKLGSGAAERLARLDDVATGPAILALKGAQSLVGGGGTPEIWVNPTGHAGLSTGGTGDVLAGVVAAHVAHWVKADGKDAASLKTRVAEALWLHGAAADRLGPGPLLVRELGPSLLQVRRELTHGA